MLQPQTKHDNLNDNLVARAAFIVGALALEGYVVIDVDDTESRQDFGGAVRLLAQLLEVTEPERPDDMPQLPNMTRNAYWEFGSDAS